MQEPFGTLTGADLYAFRAWRLRQWAKKPKKSDEQKPREIRRVKAATVNRDLRTIRAMLKMALPNFSVPKELFSTETPTRVRWLRLEDEVIVFATMPAPFGDMARLAAITMRRLTEIRTLRREQVDLAQGVVTLPRTKATPRHVVLNSEARGILARALEAAKGDLLFPNPDGQPYLRV